MRFSTRSLRLTLFSGLACLVAYFGANTALAWKFTSGLTHPACQPGAAPSADLPSPQEIQLQPGMIQLQAWYYPSQNGAAVIALGGLPGSLGDRLPPVKFLVLHGYGLLQIDSRACAAPPAAVTLGANEVMDVAAGLEFLKTRPEVARVGVLGFSMGGVTAIRAAARYPDIAAVVAEGGYFNLGEDFVSSGEHQSTLRRILLYHVAGVFWLQTGINPWRISPVDDLPRISPRPVMLIYGEDEAASGKAQAQLSAALPPKTLWLVPGGSHGRNHLAAPVEYEQRVLEFFDQALRK